MIADSQLLRERIARAIYEDFPERVFDPSLGYHVNKEWGDKSITSTRLKHAYTLADKIILAAFPEQLELL